jgi:hypothetical protein
LRRSLAPVRIAAVLDSVARAVVTRLCNDGHAVAGWVDQKDPERGWQMQDLHVVLLVKTDAEIRVEVFPGIAVPEPIDTETFARTLPLDEFARQASAFYKQTISDESHG